MAIDPGKSVAIVVGFIAKLPLAGMGLYCLHHIAGLIQLGYEVFYVEAENYPDQCYDPSTNMFTSDTTYGLRFLEDFLGLVKMDRSQYTFVDIAGQHHGAGLETLREIAERADFVMTLADPTWLDVLDRCRDRIFIDGNPLFTQCEMLNASSPTNEIVSHYNYLFSAGTRIGRSDCAIPAAGRSWRPLQPVVSTSLWQATPPPTDAAITTLMNWSSKAKVLHDGRRYGQKGQEFKRFVDLPERIDRPLRVAMGGRAPTRRLKKYGWQFLDPIEVTETLDAYRSFIATSWADLGIAKHGYVASRSGWFSDRSICYLAGGRPVLHQDTGFGDWLPTGLGVLAFNDMEALLEGIESLEADYGRHAKAARELAEEYFEASKVLGNLLIDIGLR